MIIYFRNDYSNDFINYILNITIPKKILDEYNKNIKKIKPVDDYLTSINTSVIDVIKCCIDNLQISEIENKYAIRINPNVLEERSGFKLKDLINLIDYGNLKIKGVHLIDDSLKWVYFHLRELYILYLMRNTGKES